MAISFSRRHFLAQSGRAALGLSMAGSVLAACGTQPSSTGSTKTISGDVLVWISLDDAEQRKYILKSQGTDFTKAYPAVKLTIEYKPVSEFDRLTQTAVSAGRGPDLVATPGAATAVQYVTSNHFVDLDAYAQQYNWKDKLLGWALNSGRVNGKLYSIPTSYETMLIHYNKTLFASKGYTIPKTREELEALCTKMQGQGIIPFTAGNADFKAATEWFVTSFLNHYSGPDALYQALTGKIRWTDPLFVGAIDLMNQYFQKGWFAGGVQKYFTNGFNAVASDLATGKAAMDMEGSWAFQTWPSYFGSKNNNNADWDWFPIPSLRTGVPQDIFALATGGTLSINSSSKSKDAAALYMNWLISTPQRVGREVADLSTEPLPTILKASDFPANADQRIVRSYLELGQATTKGNYGYTTWTFWPPKSDAFISSSMDKVLAGNLTPAQYCAQLDQIFQEELKAGTVPPIIPR